MADKWPRDLWLEAIWEDADLKPNERVVAYAYARYAGQGSETWCSWAELRRRTGLRSKDAVWRAIVGLRRQGWLAEIEPPRQHRSAVYRLRSPLDGPPGVRDTDLSEVRETDSTSDDDEPEVRENVTRGPGNGDQGSGKQEARRAIENSDQNSDSRARASVPPPDGRHARTWHRGHAYEPDPQASGVCLCGLPQANSVAHRRAA